MIQRIWATIIGIASTIIGILKFLSIISIPTSDAIIHIVSGLIFLLGAFYRKGLLVGYFNLFLGLFYVGFGSFGLNLPHVIVGVVSVAISLTFKPRVFKHV